MPPWFDEGSEHVRRLNRGQGPVRTRPASTCRRKRWVSRARLCRGRLRHPGAPEVVARPRGQLGEPWSAAGPDSGASAGPLAAIIPADQLAVMEQVAAATPCAIAWSVLAGLAYIE